VGCGEYPLAYFTNLDANPDIIADVHAVVPPMPFGTESLDEVWACHFLEHLSYGEGQEFLRECWRCLAPGGMVGIVVPDAREIMRRYLAGAIDQVEWPYRHWRAIKDLDAVCELFLYSTVQESPHKWSYDIETLARALTRAGFVGLREIDRYREPRIAQGAWYQVGLFGFKPKEKEDV
jgi:predicted SAM-dependent methyltransferase